MLNRALVQGRLTKDPEMRLTPNGKKVAYLTIASQRDWKGADGERGADFLNVIAWEKVAQFAADYFHKGNMVLVDGRLQSRGWKDKDDGKTRTAVEIIAQSLYFGSEKRDGSNAESGARTGKAEFSPISDDDDDGEDLPF